MSSYMQPLTRTSEKPVAAVAAGSDLTTPVFESPEDGVLSKLEYIPVAAITGANTNSRTLSLVNKSNDGSGSTTMATVALTSGVNMAANDNNAVTISSSKITAGDILEWTSVHVGTGIADPGGLVHMETTRS